MEKIMCSGLVDMPRERRVAATSSTKSPLPPLAYCPLLAKKGFNQVFVPEKRARDRSDTRKNHRPREITGHSHCCCHEHGRTYRSTWYLFTSPNSGRYVHNSDHDHPLTSLIASLSPLPKLLPSLRPSRTPTTSNSRGGRRWGKIRQICATPRCTTSKKGSQLSSMARTHSRLRR